METYNWSQFRLRIPVSSTKQQLYEAWSTSKGLESWFLRKAAFFDNSGVNKENQAIEAGDQYEWLWHGWPDEVKEQGTILEANGKDKISFVFGKAGNVTVNINNENEHLVVELLQDQIPTDERSIENYHIGCSRGWLFYLVNLKSILEGGIDLRNRDVELKDVVNS